MTEIRWAIIAGHPSLCTCDACVALRAELGCPEEHPLLTPELRLEARCENGTERWSIGYSIRTARENETER